LKNLNILGFDNKTLALSALLGLTLGSTIAISGIVARFVETSAIFSEGIRNILLHPAGIFHVHFWAPMFKWTLSGANLMDMERPVENISLS